MFKHSRWYLVWLVILLELWINPPARATPLPVATSTAPIISTFDTNNEGWRVIGDAQGGSGIPTYVSTGGNPGGYISAQDDVTFGTWYWQAPAGFLGNMTIMYGRNLSFELKQSSTSNPFLADDVILSGNNMNLVFDTPTDPGLQWTQYTVNLSETAGWKKQIDGTSPTRAEMQAVLASLTGLQIRGEFQEGPDTGGLDNVVLGSVPSNFLPFIMR